MKTAAIIVLAVALAASAAVGLLGLWPNLRSSNTEKAARAERQEKVRIADAVGAYMTGWQVSHVTLDYLPHYDLVRIKSDQFDECVRVPKDFGDRIEARDIIGPVPCNL